MDPDVDELERGADHTFEWLVASHRRDRCAFPDGVPTCVIRPDRMGLARPRWLDVVTDAMRVPVPPPEVTRRPCPRGITPSPCALLQHRWGRLS